MSVPEPLDDELFPADEESIDNVRPRADLVAELMYVDGWSKPDADAKIEEYGEVWAERRIRRHWDQIGERNKEGTE